MDDLGNFWGLPPTPHPAAPQPCPSLSSTTFSNLHFVLIPVWAQLWHLPGQASG